MNSEFCPHLDIHISHSALEFSLLFYVDYVDKLVYNLIYNALSDCG